jgi:hypothetical protein
MPKHLTADQVTTYERDGFVFPVDVLTPEEVRACRGELEAWEHARGATIDFPEKSKSYLLFAWADRLVHHPAVLDAVEDVIGPDILVYHSTLFLKEARTPAFVRWHQDSTYFYLEPHLHVTAWVALSDATVQAGCMRALPGSHRWGAFEHDDIPEPMNMIRRGQGISGRFDCERGTPMPVLAGQMSLHHTDLVHASGANDSDDRRIGLAISYIPSGLRRCACAAGTTVISCPSSAWRYSCPTKPRRRTARHWRAFGPCRMRASSRRPRCRREGLRPPRVPGSASPRVPESASPHTRARGGRTQPPR